MSVLMSGRLISLPVLREWMKPAGCWRFDHYGEAAFLGDGFQVSYQDGTATVAAGIGYVGGLRVSLREPYSLPAAVGDTLWIDASWQGFVTGEWSTVFTFCARKEQRALYRRERFSNTLSAPLAKLTAGGPQDLRPQTPDEEQSNALAEHEKSRRHPDATLTEKGFAQYSKRHRQRCRRPRRHVKSGKNRNG